MTLWTIAAVGRSRQGPERTLFDHYQGRLRGRLTLVEVEEKRPLPVDARKVREGELLLATVPPGAILVALDERGKTLDTLGLAQTLKRWEDGGCAQVVFAIGGADGHAQAVLDRADLKLALGALTWPHMLVRALVAEQLYRALCIHTGHPYHRA